MAIAPLGGAYLFANLIKSGEMFQRKMRNSLAIMGDVSKAMKDKMQATAFEVARTTVHSATDAAESYFFLASAGLNAAQSIAALPAVANFAQAGNFGMAEATDLATDAQSALGLVVKDTQQNLRNLTRVTDVLIKANTLANASAQQFSEALTAKFGAALKSVKKPLEEGAALLAAYADQGVKGNLAGETATRVTLLLQKAYLKNRAALEKYKVRIYDTNGAMQNYADIVEDLEKCFASMSTEQRAAALAQMGFTAKVQGAILPIIGCSEKIREYEKNVWKAGGTTKKVADKQLTPFQRGWARLASTFAELGANIMGGLGPGLEGILSGFASGLKWVMTAVGDLYRTVRDSPMGDFLRSFGKVSAIGLAILAIIPIVAKLGAVMSAAFVLANGPLGVTLVLAAVLGALLVELTGKGETFGEKLNDTLSKIPELLAAAAFTFRNFSKIAQIALIDIVLKLLEWFPQMEEPFQRLAQTVIGIFAGLKAAVLALVKSIIASCMEIGQTMKALGVGISAAFSAIGEGDVRNAGARFGRAFLDEFAKQTNVEGANPLKEFAGAYVAAWEGLAGEFAEQGGLKKLYETQREDLLKGITKSETRIDRGVAEAKKRAEEAAKAIGSGEEEPAGAESTGPMGAGAALKKGSAEAFHAILAASSKRDEPGKRTANNTDQIRKDMSATAIMVREALDAGEDGIDIPM